MFIEVNLVEGGKLVFDSGALVYAADTSKGRPMCEICLQLGVEETAFFLVRGSAEDLLDELEGR